MIAKKDENAIILLQGTNISPTNQHWSVSLELLAVIYF